METQTKVCRFVILFWCLIGLYLFSLSNANAATCTSVSRTNASANSVLTSSRYNSDLNALYSNSNAYDGGCITDATLEKGALNTTDFAAPLAGIKQGCAISRSDANTISVDKCIVSVNGIWVKTTAATTVTWLCSGCSAEASNTLYYVYAKTTSTSTALDLLISTTSPNGDGFDNSGNRVLGEFLNDTSSLISQYRVRSWIETALDVSFTKVQAPEESGNIVEYRAEVNCDASANIVRSFGKVAGSAWVTIGNISAGACALTFATNAFSDTPFCAVSRGVDGDTTCGIVVSSSTAASLNLNFDSDGNNHTGSDCQLSCMGKR